MRRHELAPGRPKCVEVGSVEQEDAEPQARRPARGPRLLGLYGLALVGAAAFLTDPPAGFPTTGSTGTTTPSWHGQLHNTAATLSGLALDAACIVFARRFIRRGQHAWAACSGAAVAADLATAATAALTSDFRWLLLGGAITWTWASALSVELLREHRTRGGARTPTS